MRKARPRKVRAWTFLFVLFFRRSGVCDQDRTQVPAAPACQQPRLDALSTSLKHISPWTPPPTWSSCLKEEEKEVGRCPFKTKLHSLHHLILWVSSPKCDSGFLCLFPHPNFPPPCMHFLQLREINAKKMILAPFFFLNANRHCQNSNHAWARALEQGLPQAGLTRCAALEEVSFSPYHPTTKCHSGRMLSQSLQTPKRFLFVNWRGVLFTQVAHGKMTNQYKWLHLRILGGLITSKKSFEQ